MDARVPERAAGDPCLDGLTDGAFRVWLNGLAWSVGQGTDGRVPRSALRFLHPDGPRDDLAGELVEAGVWEAAAKGWRNLHFQDDQTPAGEADRLRAESRKRQARHRAKRSDVSQKSDAETRDIERDTDTANGARHAVSRVTGGTESVDVARNPLPVVSLSPVTVSRVTEEALPTRDGVGEARRGSTKSTDNELMADLEAAMAGAASDDRLAGQVADLLGARWTRTEIRDRLTVDLGGARSLGVLRHRAEQMLHETSPAVAHEREAERLKQVRAQREADAAGCGPPPPDWRASLPA